MKRVVVLTAVMLVSVALTAGNKVSNKAQTLAAKRVIDRFLSGQTDNAADIPYHVALDMQKVDGCDQYSVEVNRQGVLMINASSPVAACRAFYDYVRRHAYGICSWSGNRVDLPATLEPEADRNVISPYRHHNYFNVVTYGYTMPYWTWAEWEKELDWMALHGTDMPLALVANEAISARVWKKLGLTDEEIQHYFVGPAHLPWMRMGNITNVDSPMPMSWHKDQVALQHKILTRMRELGMKPICPGFAGFLPPEIKRIYPEANIVETSWDAFHNWMLMADDPLFPEIGRMFIEEWEKEFGKCEYYIADSFNEMAIPFPPKGTKERYDKLAEYGSTVYDGIRKANPDAVWVMQGWMLGMSREIWDYESLSALLSHVPANKMLILDMAEDYNHVLWHNGASWDYFRGFDGKQWVYSTIPNMGGKTALTGPLEFYANGGRLKALRSPNKGNMVGYGTEPEGVENNEVVYELISDAGWMADSISLTDWLQNYTLSRYGKTCPSLNMFWDEMRQSAYGELRDWPRYLWQLQPGRYKHGTAPLDSLFLHALELFVAAAPDMGEAPLYAIDLTEMAAHYAAAKMDILQQSINNCLMWDDTAPIDTLLNLLNELGMRTDQLLSTHPTLNMQRWIDMARSHATTPEEADYYEMNAKRILTIWGPPVNDYACRIWSGLIRDFYLPRLNSYYSKVRKGEAFDVARWESDWVEHSHGLSPITQPIDRVRAALGLMDLAKNVPPTGISTVRIETLGQWNPSMLSNEWQEVQWTIPAAELQGLRGFSFRWEHGSEKLEISKVSIDIDGKTVATEEHYGETGIRNKGNDYRLTLPQSLGDGNVTLRATVRTTGNRQSYGQVLMVNKN
jgi:alpha-N-acetylglucosaminidase